MVAFNGLDKLFMKPHEFEIIKDLILDSNGKLSTDYRGITFDGAFYILRGRCCENLRVLRNLISSFQ